MGERDDKRDLTPQFVCSCCGKLTRGEPSAACFAQHEAKDCLCYKPKTDPSTKPARRAGRKGR